ncbi:MAG: ATP-binding cassette domain-containing protein [Candidatus Dormibacteraeota bacterium]|nr:ATP-binding cassette domain-containing protein [Candidatus Dormibacteraeota bacterium]
MAGSALELGRALPRPPLPDGRGGGGGRSPQSVVEIEGLVKRLGRRVLAVDGVDLTVGAGQVLALAGPNGSGKSITLRIVLGLLRPTAGRVCLFGQRVRPGARALARVGALVDGPGFVPHLSGLDNLRLAWRLTRRREAEAGLERALQVAGLGEAVARPYSTYSHGMRYRLGLAQAVLGRPDLLILDEPANGLDPLHVAEVRGLIAAEARRGATIIVAGHHLAELEPVCTHVAVMRRGRLVASGPVADVVGPADSVFMKVSDRARAREVLASFRRVGRVVDEAAGLRVVGDEIWPSALFDALDLAGVEVSAFHRGRTLQEAYVDLFREPRGGSAGAAVP